MTEQQLYIKDFRREMVLMDNTWMQSGRSIGLKYHSESNLLLSLDRQKLSSLGCADNKYYIYGPSTSMCWEIHDLIKYANYRNRTEIANVLITLIRQIKLNSLAYDL